MRRLANKGVIKNQS